MRCLKSFLLGLALIGVLFVTPVQVDAQTIGTVDADKIIANYNKAQDVEAELKVKEAEIQTFIAEAQRKIKNASTPVEKSNLEKQLSEEFRDKQTEYRKMQLDESKKINEEIIAAIEKIAGSQSIDLVLAKGAVFIGGIDITDEVLKSLNGN
ncbi:MAG: OmpH family outer membrane protein [Cyanobacteriota bacterium]